MITKEMLKIFDFFSGDIDGLARMGSEEEKRLFKKNEWPIIDYFYQDINVINKGQADKNFFNQTITKLKENCDSETFEYLRSKIKTS